MKLLYTFVSLVCLLNGKLIGNGLDQPCFSSEANRKVIQTKDYAYPTDSLNVKPFYLDIVAPSSGVQFYRNGIIFLSHTKEEESVPEKHLSFGALQAFTAPIKDTVPGNFEPIQFSESNLFPTEATTFTSDYKIMYLSLIPPRSSKEKIFRASLQYNKWSIDKEPLSFCQDKYLYTHPALSVDGTFLIFSSDMPGSIGNLDLFISRKENDKWSDPQNIGKFINTTGNELFASLDAEKNLYFSSDGLPGEGGYDIYICRFNGNGWDKPYNLSAINTDNDELALTINPEDEKSAFYTSRSVSGKNRIQLYRISLNEPDNLSKASNLSQELLLLAGINKSQTDSLPEALTLTAQNAIDNPQIIEELDEPAIETSVYKHEISENTDPEIPEEKNDEILAQTHIVTASNNTPEIESDDLIYRIQVSSNKKSSDIKKIKIAGINYNTFEYYYKGAYRTTIGEFYTLKDAAGFQNLCRRNGYDQAFVAAFFGDERITDKEAKILEAGMKKQPATINPQESVTPETVIADKPELKTTAIETPPQISDSEIVIYRVQVLANTKPVGSYVLKIAGRDYKSFEYLYMGGYRTTIGEFSNLTEATKLQNICRQNGYKQAFVVAFRNNVRSNDPELFRK